MIGVAAFRRARFYAQVGILFLKGLGYARHLRMAGDIIMLAVTFLFCWWVMAHFYTLPIPVG